MVIDEDFLLEHGANMACTKAWFDKYLTNEWADLTIPIVADAIGVHRYTTAKHINKLIELGEIERKRECGCVYGVCGTTGSTSYYRKVRKPNAR